MATLITDSELEKQLRAAREAMGADRYDEVWEGVYMMAPMPNDEHQDLVALLTSILVLSSRMVPLIFRLLPGEPRPQIQVSATTSERTWLI